MRKWDCASRKGLRFFGFAFGSLCRPPRAAGREMKKGSGDFPFLIKIEKLKLNLGTGQKEIRCQTPFLDDNSRDELLSYEYSSG